MHATSTAPVLRSFQARALDEARSFDRADQAPILMVAPTGAGKTVMGAAAMAGAAAHGFESLFLARRIELVDQASGKLDAAGLDHGVIQADHWRRRPDLPCQVASVQTLLARKGALAHFRPRLVIADEAHESLAPGYLSILTQLRDQGATIIGLTATPYLLDGTGLGSFYRSIVVTKQLHELISEGYLVPIDYRAPEKPSLAGVRVVRGEFRASDVELIMGKRIVVGNIVEHWLALARGRTTAVFADGKANARKICDAFLEAGIAAEYLDDQTPSKERKEVHRRISSGESLVVVNIGILTLGWDCPRVSCVVLARPTLSRSLFRQMIGRGTRLYPGKRDLLVLDHVGNFWRHGYPDAPEEFSLAGIERTKRSSSVVSDRVCLKCYRPSPPHLQICKYPDCGEPFPPPEDDSLTFVDGELVTMRRPDGSIVEPPKPTEEELRAMAEAIPEKIRTQQLARWMVDARLNGWKRGYPFARYKAAYGIEADVEIRSEAAAMKFPRFLVTGGDCRHCGSTDLDVTRNGSDSIVCRPCGRGLAWLQPEYAVFLKDEDQGEKAQQTLPLLSTPTPNAAPLF